jgi:hypothetical protein
MEYNGSPLTKAQWDKMERLSDKDELFAKVWTTYKELYNGMHKTAIETYTKWIKLTEIAVGAVTDGEVFTGDLPSGQVGDAEATMKYSVKRMLSDKDDKTPERISVMLKSYSEHIQERQKLINSLSDEDQTELSQSALVKLAAKHTGKNNN